MGTRDAARWAARAPAERLTLPGCGAVYAAGAILHAYGVQWLGNTWGSAALAAVAYAGTGRRLSGTAGGAKTAWRYALHVGAAIAVPGEWLAAAVAAGPAGGPHHLLTWLWAAGSLGGYWWLRRHEAVAQAREWRDRKAGWHHLSRKWHIAGSHLLSHESTRLGETMVVDVAGTGRLASQVATSSLAERIAQDRGLPRGRVDVAAHRLAGRIDISIRDQDPWARPITHPVLADNPEIVLPVPEPIMGRKVVGQVPETGAPLSLPLCDEYGGKVISVVGVQNAGKTCLLHCVCERVTAAPDAVLIKINLSIKGASERDLWGPACLLSALGDTPADAARALVILRDVVGAELARRAARPKHTANFAPSRAEPLMVIVVDEIDAAAAYPVIVRELENIASKGREFGAALLTAGQRGTAQWQGGANLRALQNVICLGTVKQSGEAMHAAGDAGLNMPNMAEYGDGKPGVWTIAGTAVPGQQSGRSFGLFEPDDIRRLVAERAHRRPVLGDEAAAVLGEIYQQLLATDAFAHWAQSNPAPGRPSPLQDAPPAPGATERQRETIAVIDETDVLSDLDSQVELHMSELGDADDLRTRWQGLRGRNDETVRMINENAATPFPGLSPEGLAQVSAERWRQLGELADITPDQRKHLTGLLTEGTTTSAVARELGITRWVARQCLEKLRSEGLARIEGTGRGASWKIIDPEPGDGS